MKKAVFKTLLAAVVFTMMLIIWPNKTNASADSIVTIQCKDEIFYDLLKKEMAEDGMVISYDDTNLSFQMTQSSVDSVTYISLSYYEGLNRYSSVIKDITGIENFKNCTCLDICNTLDNRCRAEDGSFSDLTPLKALTKLEYLTLDGTLAKSVPYEYFPNLVRLQIEGATDMDISNITVLKKLDVLSLLCCGLESSDMKYIGKLTTLTDLALGDINYGGNDIVDISALKPLTNLENLNLSNNDITDITTVKAFTNLTGLSIRNNPITDISPVSGLTKLTYINMGRDGYGGDKEGILINGKIDALKSLTNLTKVCASHCGITDVSVFASLPKLVYLDVSYNSITDFAPIKNIKEIQIYNQIYTMNVKSGDTVDMPAIVISAMNDSNCLVYNPDITVKAYGCTVSGTKVIFDKGQETATVYGNTSNSRKYFSFTLKYNVELEKIPPKVTVTYSTTDLTTGSVVVTLVSDEPITGVSGLSAADATCKKFTKEYTSNASSTFKVSDICGNKTEVNINVSNIGYWKELNNKYYFILTKSGSYVKEWQKIDGKWYYFGTDCVMRTKWQQIDGSWYYFGGNGKMVTGWQQIGGNWYKFEGNGKMLTGWQKISGSWYYFGSNGKMAAGWQQVSGSWYRFGSDGKMLTGWQKISGSWYRFGSDGKMLTGWQKINGNWYYFGTDGKMVSNTTMTIDGKKYTFNESGVMA